MRTVIFTICAIFSSIVSYSQVNLNTYGSFIRDLNPENKENTLGAGVRVEFAEEESNFSKYVGFAYALPVRYTEELQAQSMSSSTSPSSVKVTANYSRPMFQLEVGLNLYLAGAPDNFENFNWYIGGVAAVYLGNKPSYSSYDEDNYSLGYTKESSVNRDGSPKYILNLHIAAMTGIEKNLGPGNVFFQTGVSFPAVKSNTIDEIASFSPVPLSLNLGYKISLSRR
jgi:hypothetical protein